MWRQHNHNHRSSGGGGGRRRTRSDCESNGQAAYNGNNRGNNGGYSSSAGDPTNGFVNGGPRIREHNTQHWGRFAEVLRVFRDSKSRKYCDIQIKVGEKLFHAHKVILAANSQYFDALLSSPINNEEAGIIEIKETEPKIFELILNYMYEGHLTQLDEGTACELLAAANMFAIDEIVTACYEFIRKHLEPANCVGIYRFADMHSCVMLRLEAKRYVESHFSEIVDHEEFLAIPSEMMENFLKSEGLSVDSEFQIFASTMRWILAKPEERLQHIFSLLSHIRLPIISQKQIQTFIEECDNVPLTQSLKKIVDDYRRQAQVFRDARRENRNQLFFDVRCQPRMCSRKSVYMIGGYHQSTHRWSDGNALTSVERYDIYRNQWLSLPALINARSCHAVIVFESVIYCMGGEAESLLLDSIETFDPIENRWDVLNIRMTSPRSSFGIGVVDGFIYLFGGIGATGPTNLVERFDPREETWEYVAELPEPLYSMGVEVHDGRMYILGGFDSKAAPLSRVLCYDPVKNAFRDLRPMNVPRASFGIALMHNQIYITGGTDGTNVLKCVERYSLAENNWQRVCDLKRERVGASVAVIRDQLVVIGGRMANTEYSIAPSLSSVEKFNPLSNKWTDSVAMPTTRADAGLVVL